MEMLNEGGFHVRALDPASADDLRARVAGDATGDDDKSSSGGLSRGSSGTRDGDSGAAEGGVVGGASRRRAWEGPEWRRGTPQERRKIKMVPVLTADHDGEARCRRGGTGEDAGTDDTTDRKYSAGKCGEHKAASSSTIVGDAGGDAPAATAREGALRRHSSNNDGGGKEGEGGGGGSWGYKEHGLGKILAFVARRRNQGGGGGGGC